MDYLIRNGSEKVIESGREHTYEMKALKSFYYIDDKGKDQGINGKQIIKLKTNLKVRNRSEEILALLASPEKVKEERAKAKETKGKYSGMSNDAHSGGFSISNNNNSNYPSYRENSRDTAHGRERDDYDEFKKIPTVTPAPSSPKKPVVVVAATKPAPDLMQMDNAQIDDDWGDFTAAGSSEPVVTLVPITNPNPSQILIANNNLGLSSISFNQSPKVQTSNVFNNNMQQQQPISQNSSMFGGMSDFSKPLHVMQPSLINTHTQLTNNIPQQHNNMQFQSMGVMQNNTGMGMGMVMQNNMNSTMQPQNNTNTFNMNNNTSQFKQPNPSQYTSQGGNMMQSSYGTGFQSNNNSSTQSQLVAKADPFSSLANASFGSGFGGEKKDNVMAFGMGKPVTTATNSNNNMNLMDF